MGFNYHTNCVSANGEDISQMFDAGKAIKYRTFIKHVGAEVLSELFPHYSWKKRDGGLKLKDDRHVDYYRSKYQGVPCVFMVHSCIEYVFLKV